MTFMEVAAKTIDQGALGALMKAFTGGVAGVSGAPAPSQMGVGAISPSSLPQATGRMARAATRPLDKWW